MRYLIHMIAVVFSAAIFTACAKDDLPIIKDRVVEKYAPISVSKENKMQLYAHYMPWFETKETNGGSWGMHWTMANKNPDNIVDGKHEIASHYYPLIGPYASSDVEVIRYHLLLMKYSGVDGILIDWYGVQNKNDYSLNKKNTEVIVQVLEEVGLNFAIVYEDQTLAEVVSDEEKVNLAKDDLKYLETNFFSKDSYIKLENKPLLLVFGPQSIKNPELWNDILSSLKVKPNFMTLYAHSNATNNVDYKNAMGEYIWVDATDIDTKYKAKDNFDLFIGGAYPGFNDFYPNGGWGENALASIDHQQGKLFTNLLQKALDNKVDYLQLITWNDFGEGTMIEPTKEFGYTFLTQLQEFSKVSYKQEVLESILDLYELKKNVKNKDLSLKLEQAFYCLVSLKVEEAKALMNEVKNY